ncbi:S-layer homology domain-containing protein [Paenibacillus mendelii]|uniref:S-layer homology domain-containing protein n=1 Tax=Paenibacillus mendelii TaxID=206163 RepID=A0ABV6JAM8_9BACL|nr:S-layer homology domain-containing protein [Paenibacillus mendelii]MCQ6563150.1 S-layer homology domain-containing protein [Paenibacillus mendelii]
MAKTINQRLLPIVIVMSMIASLWGQVAASAAASGEASVQSDLSGHWAEDTMAKWVENGLLIGDGAGQYRPNDVISRAEFAALVDRVFNLPLQAAEVNPFADVKSNSWYAGAIANVYAGGMIQGTGKDKFEPEAAITRQDVAVILARAFELQDAPSTGAGAAFSDAASISAYASAAVASLQSRQYIRGRSGNRFAPQEHITRAEAVQMIDNVMGSLIRNEGTYERDYAGNVVVNTAGVELKNLVIAGCVC